MSWPKGTRISAKDVDKTMIRRFLGSIFGLFPFDSTGHGHFPRTQKVGLACRERLCARLVRD